MEKQDIDIKLEVHTKQEKVATSTSPQKNDIKNIFTLLTFIPGIFLILLILSHFYIYFSFFKIMFFIVATVSIWIYTYYAFEIHGSDKKLIENKWRLYNQYWLNGLGAFIGWSALYFILFYRIGVDNSSLCWACLECVDWPDFVIGLIAFFGITGYFPYAVLIGKLPINK